MKAMAKKGQASKTIKIDFMASCSQKELTKLLYRKDRVSSYNVHVFVCRKIIALFYHVKIWVLVQVKFESQICQIIIRDFIG